MTAMNWDRVNGWTNTLYSIIQALSLSKQIKFGDLDKISENIQAAANWLPDNCSYASILTAEPFGRHRTTFRRDPNANFEQITANIIRMLVQDLTVIFDEMMDDTLASRGERAGNYPQSKVEKLAKGMTAQYVWSANGCLELIAARNVLTHNGGIWNLKSIAIVSFLAPPPAEGEQLVIGFPMLFKYRKAMRTFLNEAVPPQARKLSAKSA